MAHLNLNAYTGATEVQRLYESRFGPPPILPGMAATTETRDSAYRALTAGAGLVDRSELGKLALTGAQAAEMLNGQVSNDVEALGEGVRRHHAGGALLQRVDGLRVVLDGLSGAGATLDCAHAGDYGTPKPKLMR